jgi:hypothetical protein
VGNDAPASTQTLKALASIRACKTRAILTDEQAIRIYQIKLDNHTASASDPSSAARAFNFRAGTVARAFGVSDKAIRDIWKGRTWLRETMHLDPARAAMAALLRPPGRPKGRSPRPAAAAAAAPPFARAHTLSGCTHGVSRPAAVWRGWAREEEGGGPPPRRGGAVPLREREDGPARDFDSEEDRTDPSLGESDDQPPSNRASDSPSESSTPPPPPPPLPACGGGGGVRREWGAPQPAPRCGAAPAHPAAAAAAFAAAVLHGAAAGLPASSRADDPFHDDWAHW